MSMDVRKAKLDFNKVFQDDIPSVQGDTGRSIEFQIMDGSVAKDITGETIKIFGLKPDGFRVFNNATITDAPNGKCVVDLTAQMLCVTGIVQCTLVRYKNNQKLSSRKFNIEVAESVADDIEIESTNEYLALTEALNITADNINTSVNLVINEMISNGDLANMTIEDNSISGSKYKNNSISNSKLEDHIITPNKIDISNSILKAGYAADVKNQGEHIAENWYLTDFIPVVKNDVVKVNLGRNTWISLWDSNKQFVGAVETDGTAKERTYTVANGISYVRFNIYKDNVSEFTVNINSITVDMNMNKINIPWLEVNNSNIMNNSITSDKMDNSAIFAKQGYAADGSHGGGEYEAENWYLTDFVPVKEGDIITVNLGRYTWVSFWNANEEYVSCMKVDDTAKERTCTIASGIYYVRFNIYKDNVSEFIITKNSQKVSIFTEKTSLSWLSINEENLSNNIINKINANTNGRWYGKNMIMFGDSIVQDVTNSNGGYVTRLKTNLGLATATNKGISGRPMSNGSANGVGTNTTVKTITNFDDYDLLLIAAGTNDFKLNIPLGDIGQIGDTEFNTEAFYGAYRDTIEYILKLKPTIRICLWTPLQRDNANYDVNYTNSAGHKLIDYVDAIIAIGEMYAIPVIDLYRNSGVTKLTLSTFTADGLHLNSKGYDYVTMYASKQINNI